MPTFDLVTHSAKISTPVRGPMSEGVERWRLALTASIPPGNSLALATGEDVSSLELTVVFSIAAEGAEPPGGGAHYFPGRIIFDCVVAPETMAELLAFAKQGRFPDRVSIGTATNEGLTHDNRPDGSGLKWANDRVPVLPFDSFWFDLPIGAEPVPPAPEKRVPDWPQWTFWLLLIIGVLMNARGVGQ